MVIESDQGVGDTSVVLIHHHDRDLRIIRGDHHRHRNGSHPPARREELDRPDYETRDLFMGKDLRRAMVAAAMLDRLLHRSVVFNIDSGMSPVVQLHQTQGRREPPRNPA